MCVCVCLHLVSYRRCPNNQPFIKSKKRSFWCFLFWQRRRFVSQFWQLGFSALSMQQHPVVMIPSYPMAPWLLLFFLVFAPFSSPKKFQLSLESQYSWYLSPGWSPYLWCNSLLLLCFVISFLIENWDQPFCRQPDKEIFYHHTLWIHLIMIDRRPCRVELARLLPEFQPSISNCNTADWKQLQIFWLAWLIALANSTFDSLSYCSATDAPDNGDNSLTGSLRAYFQVDLNLVIRICCRLFRISSAGCFIEKGNNRETSRSGICCTHVFPRIMAVHIELNR